MADESFRNVSTVRGVQVRWRGEGDSHFLFARACGVVEDGPDPTASDPASVLATQGSEPSETGK